MNKLETVATRFDAIFIDFYGTIADGDHAAVEQACQKIVELCELPVEPTTFAVIWGERFFQVIDESNGPAFRTLYECELLSLKDTLARFDRDVDPRPLVQDLEDYWQNPPIHADALETLRRLDLPLCCVSNADTQALLTAIERHNLAFDWVVSSEMARSYKPDARIFRMALERTETTPDRVFHIGDSLHSDIRGALSVGISPVWLCREQRIHDIGNSRPWQTIHSLTDLHKLL